MLKNSEANIVWTDGGAETYALFAIGDDLRDVAVDLAPLTGVCGLDLKSEKRIRRFFLLIKFHNF